MSLIANCLKKLAAAGQITDAAAKAALATWEGTQGKLLGAMPPANADAAAALEAAKIMAEAAKRQKVRVAKDAIALRSAMDRVEQHPHSKAAGLLGVLTPDIREGDGGINVESLGRVYEEKLFGKANDLIEAYNSKLAGLSHDYLGPRKVIRELKGDDTGDETAKLAADAFGKSVDEGIALAEAAGRMFRSQAERDAWGSPQFWESYMVRKLARKNDRGVEGSYLIGRAQPHINSGALVIVDPKTGLDANPLQIPAILQDAFTHIVMNESKGAVNGPFNPKVRVFRFTRADAFLDMMDEFGAGKNGYYPMLAGHLRSMAHEAAMVGVLGPSYHSNFRQLHGVVKRDEKLIEGSAKQLNPLRLVESARAAERTFKMLTGELNAVDSELVAGIAGGLRNIATAANLGSAVVTALPGDSVTATLARSYNGIPASKFLFETLGEIAKGKDGRAIAARLEITANAAIDTLRSISRFGGEFDGQARAARLSELVIRGQGLADWTMLQKRIFSMDFLGHIANVSGQAFDELEPAFQNFLKRHKFDSPEWDAIRATEQFETPNGATFFDSTAMADRKLADRLMSAIMDERSYAVLEAGARVRGLASANMRRGTIPGELARTAFMYKSFAMSIILTHGMRAVSSGNLAQKGVRLGKFLFLMTVAGAASTQAKQLLQGKDPRDMSANSFWLDAFITGGGSGIYGDLLKQGFDPRYQSRLMDLALGPGAQLAADVEDLTLGNVRDLMAGESANPGRDLARMLKKWTPNTFYTRLVADRYLWDEIQSHLDPDYRDSFARQEQRLREATGQKFWFKPGTSAPQRGPDLSKGLQ